MIFKRQEKSAATSPTHPTGSGAEKLAETYLVDQGLRFLDRNFNCKLGEIDLIMEDKNVLVFVEVRFRKSSAYGTAVETVTLAKQQKLVRAAQHYLLHNKAVRDRPMRFDIVGIMPGPTGLRFDWLPNAFCG